MVGKARPRSYVHVMARGKEPRICESLAHLSLPIMLIPLNDTANRRQLQKSLSSALASYQSTSSPAHQ